MNHAEALMLIADLQDYFPVPVLPIQTQELWATALERFDYAIGAEAIKLRAEFGTHGHPIQLSDVLEFCEDLELSASQTSLPDYSTTEPAPAEVVAAALADYWSRIGDKARALSYRARKLGGPARIEAVRAVTLAKIEAEKDAPKYGQLRPLIESATSTSACGALWGMRAIEDGNGVWRCPVCGSDIAEGCSPIRVETV